MKPEDLEIIIAQLAVAIAELRREVNRLKEDVSELMLNFSKKNSGRVASPGRNSSQALPGY